MEDVDRICARLAAELEADLDQLTTAMLDDLASSVPKWLLEPPLWDQIADFGRGNCRAELQCLREGGELPAQFSPADAEAAREAAKYGTPISMLLDGYRSGHRALWNGWSNLVDEQNLDPELASAVRRRGSDFFFAYAARLSSLVAEEYDSARPAGSGQVRLNIVRALLDGEAVDASPLDYPVDGWHVGLVGSGTQLAETLAASARKLDCRLLLLDIYEDPWWAWMGRTRPFNQRIRAAIASLEPGDGGRMGISTELRSAAGFRETNRQASCAFRATTRERPRVAYPDVAMEDLASRDLEAAKTFVAAELGPVSGTPNSERLLETLSAYFECGQNARATAAMLGVHHQTVAQRIQAIGKQTGRPVSERRAELELALRLRRYLRD